MPTGPKGQKRPADVVANPIPVAKIATGEATETIPDDGKDSAAKALGKKGGAARAKSMTPERRAEIVLEKDRQSLPRAGDLSRVLQFRSHP
jgi:acyl-CoA reductase-like NAD-dependent aldehyde dehydrogenase